MNAQPPAGTFDCLNLNARLTYRGQSRPWTNKDEARLRYLWDDLGMTARECGKLMGRSHNSILSACRRFDLSRRDCPIRTVWKPDLVRQRQAELARIAAIEELMGTAA